MDTISLIVGSCSLIIATLQYKYQISNVNSYELVAKELADFQGAKSILGKNEKHIVGLLSIGTSMIAQLRGKAQRRLILASTTIVTFSIGWSADLSAPLHQNAEVATNWIFGIIVVVIGLGANADILDGDEKIFIKNMNSLNDIYYRTFVLPAIKTFNELCEKNNLIKIEGYRYAMLEKRLEKEINNRFEASKKLQESANSDN